jgi:molybdopterin-containing oxidoreductase family iron-sulfur binding subunit
MPPAVQAVLAETEAQAALAAVAGGDAGRDLARAVARDLGRHAGASLVIAGEQQPAAVHVLAYMMNAALGNLGRTVKLTEPVLGQPEGAEDLAALVAEMRAGAVDTLVLLEANPCYTAPAELEFTRWLGAVKDSLCLSLYENETGRRCRWFAPAAHYLEAWGDARAYDGTLSIVQPLVRPLLGSTGGSEGGRTPAEVLAMVLGDAAPDGHALLRESWSSDAGGRSAGSWEEVLGQGFVKGSALPEVTVALRWDEALRHVRGAMRRRPAGGAGGPAQGTAIEIAFQRSPTLHDGRFANNAWLRELPLPITKLTWDNAAFLSRTTARRLGVSDEQGIEIRRGARTVRLPALIVPGHADGAVTLLLGYGREGAERLAAGHGVNVYPLRTSEALSFALDGVARPLSKKERSPLALTQTHWSMHGRPIAPTSTLEEYRRDPDFTAELKGPVPSLLPEDRYEGLQWAMSIDLSICTGCSACMVACQAENNVPVVGKEEVRKSREMHWLRIDTYFTGAVEEPGVVHQPMLCQHCEKAPCEYVCPVNATVHSPDGLNEMVYNRCVGTRFCSNNCPYKVRRFNWFDWGEHSAAEPNPNRGLAELQHNPDVTVRERGVMEKCTYCVQRIRQAEMRAQIEGRAVRPGEVVTACQQACPTRAIQFDSLSHADTEMVRWRKEPRSYAVLHDQGTQPRTMYLARINNPNPELK